MTDRVLAGFLSGHEGKAFCSKCLADMLTISRRDVIAGTSALRSSGEVEILDAVCANCLTWDVVIRCAVAG